MTKFPQSTILEHQLPLELNDPRRECRAKRVRRISHDWFEPCAPRPTGSTRYVVAPETLAD